MLPLAPTGILPPIAAEIPGVPPLDRLLRQRRLCAATTTPDAHNDATEASQHRLSLAPYSAFPS
jgi:hypothetical protein